METFGFLIHPMDIDDVARKYRIAKKINPKVVASIVKRRRPLVWSEITGIKSITGKEAVGWFIAVPFLPHQFFDLEEEYVIEKIVKACEIGRKEGARIIGLGAFTAIPGGGGRMVSELSSVPITTGNTYTVVTAIEGTIEAASRMQINLATSTLAIVGATGSIGSACAHSLADKVGEIILIGRDEDRLTKLSNSISTKNKQVTVSTSVASVRAADIIITVTGAADSVIEPTDIKSGAVVCDVARPRDVSEQVAKRRNDVLVIDGGIVKIPGNVRCDRDYGLPRGLALGCMAETMMLALEGRYENYTIGKDISLEKVDEMKHLADKHGFKLAGLRSFEKKLSDEHIAAILRNAKTKPSAMANS
ncbi:MAG: polysaccharide biosynthesis protein [Actinomycetota bacterium]|nr:polysaccharide biosynthesis protein [Actinomycetota bacterium]